MTDTGQLSSADRDAVFAKSGGRCQCTSSHTVPHPTVKGGTRCTRIITKRGRWHAHRKDRSKPHTVSNCIAICIPCHEGTSTYGKPK